MYLIKNTFCIILLILITSSKISSQSIFDKIENYLIKHRLQVNYGVQSSWYKEGNIHLIQKKYDRDIIYHDVSGYGDAQIDFLGKGQLGVPQFRINIGIDISEKYSVNFLATHLTYHVNVENEYYRIGKWDGNFVSDTILLNNKIKALEHSNGINIWNIAITRTFKFNLKKLNMLSFEIGLSPNIGIVGTACQGGIVNPQGIIEHYDPGNSFAGFNYAGEGSFKIILYKHWITTLNFNYFQMNIKKAKLEEESYVKQELRGYNYGISIGYKF